MKEVVEVSAGRRRAALTLHALTAHDREWLLAQLPADHREELRGLLAELSELGIPADGDVIRAALAEAAPASAMPDAKAYARVLSCEAEALRGVLLSLLAPAQRDAVLAQWPLALEARPSAAAMPSWTPRLQGALLESWQQLAATEESSS